MLSIDHHGFDVLAKVPQGDILTNPQYHWKEFRFTFKEPAKDAEDFCRMLVGLEEEGLQTVKSCSGYGWQPTCKVHIQGTSQGCWGTLPHAGSIRGILQRVKSYSGLGDSSLATKPVRNYISVILELWNMVLDCYVLFEDLWLLEFSRVDDVWTWSRKLSISVWMVFI